jgi:nicotinate phosphoribosyltransferase
MQVFQKNEALLCGMDEALAILRECSGRSGPDGAWAGGWDSLEVEALHDGDRIHPHETVMTISGDYSLFAHLETCLLGVLGRRTRIATNTRAVVEAAKGKPVLFFPARFDHHLIQEGDGYASWVAGAFGVSTDAQGQWWGSSGLGTIPHALIAAYGGDTVKATEKFARHIDPSVSVISLVDLDNDCVGTSLKVARALGKSLWGVRLDTSGTMVDMSLWKDMGSYPPTGVCPRLVEKLRTSLNEAGFDWVKIIVSGGFTAEKIALFEEMGVPADVYAVGSSLLKGVFDFTADVVRVKDGDTWKDCAKVGREYKPNPRLQKVP